MNRLSTILIICVHAAASDAVAAGVKVRVTGDHVNLRPTAGGKSAVVSQVDTGDVLFAPNGIGEGEWVEVETPATADLWVYGELVRGDTVCASRVQVRSGPGTNYKVIGMADKGDRVDVRGRQGDWLKIAPLPECTLWISRDYVEPFAAKPVQPVVPTPRPPTQVFEPRPRPAVPVPPPAVPKPVVPSPVRPVPVPAPRAPKPARPPAPSLPEPVVVTSRPGKLPPALAKRRLVASKKQGEAVEYVGVLRPAGLVWGRPSRYRLVMRDDAGRALALCYILGNEAQLERIVGRTLHVTGHRYWVQGVRTPVVAPVQIIRKD